LRCSCLHEKGGRSAKGEGDSITAQDKEKKTRKPIKEIEKRWKVGKWGQSQGEKKCTLQRGSGAKAKDKNLRGRGRT